MPHKELKQIINSKRKINKENKFTHFTVLHRNHSTKVKKTTKTLIYYQCYQGHRIIDCVKFKQKTAIERKNFINEQKLCLNCLSKAHMLRECQLEFRCRLDGCRQKHHTLTHKEPLDDQNGNSDNRKQSPTQNNIPTDGNVNSFSKSNLRGPFLHVLPVHVTDKNREKF